MWHDVHEHKWHANMKYAQIYEFLMIVIAKYMAHM